MRYLFFLLCFILSFSAVHAQYWFGPKIGFQRTDFNYQEETYARDSFNVNSDYGFQLGGIMIYQASERYAVQAELMFEHVDKKVTELEGSDIPIYSKTKFNFLTLPLGLRWNFGSEPTYYYVSGGPKLSFWLGGSGELLLDEMQEAQTLEEPVPYDFVFNQDKANPPDSRAIVDANRVQYGLHIGGGMYFDLRFGGRLQVDFRYTFGHSNMGFNNNPDFDGFVTYQENFEFRNNTLSASIAYLFEYDLKLQSKGMSTIKESNSKKKKK